MASTSSREASSSSPMMSFMELPEEVQLSILSLLSPPHIASFACTSRRSASLCSSPDLWLALCLRRWGPHALLPLPPSSTSPSLLHRTLHHWDRLLGFWRRVGHGTAGCAPAPPLVFFEWGPPCIIVGSRIAPSPDPGSLGVHKIPFLSLGMTLRGEALSFLRVGEGPESVLATVSFMGESHLVVEEIWDWDCCGEEQEVLLLGMGMIRERVVGRRRESGEECVWMMRRRRWETEHLVKVSDCYPTPLRPLQGLWKGICEGMKLDFFLVTCDDIGGLACRRVGDSLEPFSGYSPVFWTSNTTFIEPPFPREEEDIYSSRDHIHPLAAFNCNDAEEETVSCILCINSSYDLVIPDLPGSSTNLRNVEGRIWMYKSGTFGFGFLRNDFIVDMKPIAVTGSILDEIE